MEYYVTYNGNKVNPYHNVGRHISSMPMSIWMNVKMCQSKTIIPQIHNEH